MLDNIIEVIQKEVNAKFGIFCLNSFINRCSIKMLSEFTSKNNIKCDENSNSKIDCLRRIALHCYKEYHNKFEMKEKYSNSLDYIGSIITSDMIFEDLMIDFDFLSKQELIDVFANYCADLGISVFDASNTRDYNLDLYLTRKTPRLRTEAVVVRTGSELDSDCYHQDLKRLESAGKIASWTVYVITPIGAQKVNLNKIIKDMEELKIWLYVIDPVREKIMGITRGKKAKTYDPDLRDQYIKSLPIDSIRSPSQVIKISKYNFSESDSYNSSNFTTFSLVPEEDFNILSKGKIIAIKPKYREIFRNIIIISIDSGVPILSYTSEVNPMDDGLLSGFLTAMDNFVSEIGGSDNILEDINYKGVYIQAAYGKLVKIALFLSKPSDQILKERLAFFIRHFEEKNKMKIEKFIKSGEASLFDSKEFKKHLEKILLI